MFLDIAQPLVFTPPWHMSFGERLAMLHGGGRRIAYFYENPDTSTFRYRVLNPVQAINKDLRPAFSASWFCMADLMEKKRFIDDVEILVLCRTKYGPEVADLLAQANARNIELYFDCDDLVFDPNRVHLVLDSLDIKNANVEHWDAFYAYSARLSLIFDRAENFIGTNDYLLNNVKRISPLKKLHKLENFLNAEQQIISRDMYFIKKQWNRDERIHIGYFSGSPTHVKDFAVALPALKRLMTADDRINLRIVGFAVFSEAFAEFGDRVEIIPLQDYLNLQRLVAEVEINIAPLQLNDFTNCKSELKYFEAAACGTLTIASPTYAFSHAIEHGRTGILSVAQDWDSALARAVRLVEDRKAYQEVVDVAFDHVTRIYGFDRFSAKLETIFNPAR